MSPRDPIRPTIRHMQRNGIGEVARLGLGQSDVLPLWFGETDLVTPDFIRDAAKRALDGGRTFYTFTNGIPELRAAIADFHKRFIDADIAVERITVPGSAMLGVKIALDCVVETGDNVVIVAPIWPNIFEAARAAGAETRLYPLHRSGPGGRWQLDLDGLFARCDARTKAIFVASPGNPTGWIMSAAEQKALLDSARQRGIAIIADEVYGTLVYEGRHAPSFLSIAEENDAVFVINSFSKAWAMTGWRIGWFVGPKNLFGPLAQLSAVNNTGATTFAQWGALAAVRDGDGFIKEMVARCARGRDIVQRFIEGQNRLSWAKPEGAFYGFIAIEGLPDSIAFAKELLATARVGVAPGMAFGTPGDPEIEKHIRICFAQDPKRLETALGRIGDALRTI